jgi:hypothetical protein
MTPAWKTYVHPLGHPIEKVRQVYSHLDELLPREIRTSLDRSMFADEFRQALWDRAAMWQGTHMSVLRGITGSLFLSGYHGPAVSEVLIKADITRVAQRDVRPMIGRTLLGREVRYPASNPWPPTSAFRVGLARPQRFLDAVAARGIEIRS